MDYELILFFSVPFLIGLSIGFVIKSSLNRYEKRRAFDKHMDELFTNRYDTSREGHPDYYKEL